MTPGYMLRAIELAQQARGSTAPNPPVGAVLVRGGSIVGEGMTQPGGRPHAETIALAAAGGNAAGASLYVTLEPCSHWGKTPPCADALVAAGIREANIAILDPNPEVCGQGAARLRIAGILTTVGACSDEAAEIAEGHLTFTLKHRPFVTVTGELPPLVMRALVREHDLTILGQHQDDLPDDLGRPFLRLYRTPESLRLQPSDARADNVSASSCASFDVRNYGELVDFLGRSGHRAILFHADGETRDTLAAQHLIDKLVTGDGATYLRESVPGHQATLPSPHCVLYPPNERE